MINYVRVCEDRFKAKTCYWVEKDKFISELGLQNNSIIPTSFEQGDFVILGGLFLLITVVCYSSRESVSLILNRR